MSWKKNILCCWYKYLAILIFKSHLFFEKWFKKNNQNMTIRVIYRFAQIS